MANRVSYTADETTLAMYPSLGDQTGTSDGVPAGTGPSGPGSPGPGQGTGTPAPVPAPGGGRPMADFTGKLPYATELFGVYQPLVGWYGQHASERAQARPPDGAPVQVFHGAVAVDELSLDSPLRSTRRIPAAWSGDRVLRSLFAASASPAGVLSPVGLVHMYRQYFFEFDTFLGPPAGHVWLSPGGTVELVEASTRKRLIEQTLEATDEITRKSEEAATSQDEIADAVKEDNQTNTKLGASANAGGSFAGIYHADASASFNLDTSRKQSQEVTHKQARTQSEKVSSEIRRSFKTTFRTVTETTDTSSRRYVVQNTTDKLVNYELRRKMRKVGVQMQHLGSRLCWQVYVDDPGRGVGLGELVLPVEASGLAGALAAPAPLERLKPVQTEYPATLPLMPKLDVNFPRMGEDYRPDGNNPAFLNTWDNDYHLHADYSYVAAPPDTGYTLTGVSLKTAVAGGGPARLWPTFRIEDAGTGRFGIRIVTVNYGGHPSIDLVLTLSWAPPPRHPQQEQYEAAVKDYRAKLDAAQRADYTNALRRRLKVASHLTARPTDDLRAEERSTVYGILVQQLMRGGDQHVSAELIRQIFDIDEMLYFVAPDYWRPKALPEGAAPPVKYEAKPPPSNADGRAFDSELMLGWYGHRGTNLNVDHSGAVVTESRNNYLITEESAPAPKGSSLGWLIQLDGDERRNEFLNATWVKAVLPVRPGHESEALAWLRAAGVEGAQGMDDPYPVQPGDPAEYQGMTIGQVLEALAMSLESSNTDMANTLATEEVFEKGFRPLEGGFRVTDAYEVFDQWLEVLPTDQVVAVAVEYDPLTGEQK